MLDDFLIRALLAGIGIALITGPLGCFVVWRKMAYFGDTMAHSGILGVALGLLLGIDPTIGVLITAIIIAIALLLLQNFKFLATDSLLGILSHSSLSMGLVVISFITWLRVDLMAFLFGDILAVSRFDLMVIYGGGAVIITILIIIWRPLLALSVDANLAKAEGINIKLYQFIFTMMIAVIIAIAIKIIGVMLITSLLIIPAVAVRKFSKTPEEMAIFSVIAGIASVVIGLFLSYEFDTPSGPSIIIASFMIFSIGLLPFIGRKS